MNTPIQPSAPVSAIITIQPVTHNIPNPDAAPSPLAQLPSGTVVEGFVVNRDAQNNPILRTSIGDLRVTSEVFLKTGSEVVFKVDTTQASLARIVTVDGLSPQDYNAQNAPRGLTQDTVTTTPLQPGATPLLAAAGKPGMPGTAPLLQALMLQGHALAPTPLMALAMAQGAPMPLLTQLAQLRPGAPVRLTLLDLKLPPLPVALSSVPQSHALESLMPPRAGVAGGMSTMSSSASPSPTPMAHTSLPPTAAGVAAPAPGQQRAEAPAPAPALPAVPAAEPAPALATTTQPHNTSPALASLLSEPQAKASPPSAAPPPPAPSREFSQAASPHAVVAQVIGHEADGANILHTLFATLKLYTPQPLPTGTSLLVEPSLETNAAAATPAPATELAAEEKFFSDAMRDWKSLDDALNWLKQNAPDAARDIAQRLPVPGHKLASSLLFFVAALKGGEVDSLFGKRALRLLEASAPQLLAKLRADTSQIQANFVDSPLSHWSWVALPMLVQGELEQARLYISKEPPKEDSSSNEGRGQRFILEVGMSELGALQFDGFVRQQPTSKSFDLVVRTAQPLTEDIAQGIRGIFTTSLEVTGMQGQVLFQHGAQHFIRPLAEQKPAQKGGYGNTILA